VTPPKLLSGLGGDLFNYRACDLPVNSSRGGNVDFDVLQDEIEEQRGLPGLKNHINKRVAESTGADRNFHEELVSAFEKRTLFDVFVASFSECGDSLGQWRAYSQDGIGFSIGFDTRALGTGYVSDPSASKSHFVSGLLGRVRYLGGETESSVLDEILEWARGFGQFTAQSFATGVTEAQWTSGMLSVIAPKFKHKAFQEEREWRLMLSKIPGPMPAKRFRGGDSTLIPYVEAEPQMKEGYFIK
jgi:hypothetical protein